MSEYVEDYSNFSAASLEKSFHEMLDDVKKQTGATEEEVLQALAVSANKFMDVNCFELGQ